MQRWTENIVVHRVVESQRRTVWGAYARWVPSFADSIAVHHPVSSSPPLSAALSIGVGGAARRYAPSPLMGFAHTLTRFGASGADTNEVIAGQLTATQKSGKSGSSPCSKGPSARHASLYCHRSQGCTRKHRGPETQWGASRAWAVSRVSWGATKVLSRLSPTNVAAPPAAATPT